MNMLANVFTHDNQCFAVPTGELFVGDEYVGTIYLWNDGSETTRWAEGDQPSPRVVITKSISDREN